MDRDNVIDIVRRLRTVQQRNRGLIPVKVKIILSSAR